MTSRSRLAQLASHTGSAARSSSTLAASVAAAGGVTAGAAGGPVLTGAQVEAYLRDGFVVCSGLIPEPIVAAAVDALWEQMAGPPKSLEQDGWANEERNKYRPKRDDPASCKLTSNLPLLVSVGSFFDGLLVTTGAGGWAGIVDGPAIVATFTPALIDAFI